MKIITAQTEVAVQKILPSIYETWGRDPVLHHLKTQIKTNDRVIDLGCGDGCATAQIASMTRGLVAGIDCNEILITRAKKDFGEYKNLNFFYRDFLREVPGIQVEWVVCLDVLNFLSSSQLERTFNHTERTLWKFGRGVFLMIHPAAPREHWPHEKARKHSCQVIRLMLKSARLQIEKPRRLWVNPPAYGSPTGKPPTFWMFQVRRMEATRRL
ncbi:MAG: hypothetical protein A3F54_02770 [Candidatus Kerfeldbacteria bacterium RIFCSPHIGHO2_12_FULL_48_17]|uniref:Methyltransferase domain-containing protein n=1 Tax=Candidatus Kerfeldbacteria bacterium RIFCSPHIGHO2_12_FULL_48_17 TaxID=1798542 RepID=A0A1G2B4X5_9BACT|nr:MAG: hypothetical protein A3F54_02770 [Candidatus Kerfeldbacteria bacterium RIFCSPHIGHO2_12_FULL_48_17]